jgi:hypothetical protein
MNTAPSEFFGGNGSDTAPVLGRDVLGALRCRRDEYL